MRLFLVGYMGSGKTTFGKKLANRSGLKFLDLDQLIESEEGQTISEIFESAGEAEFRKIEAEKLRSIVLQDVVIATGGGCPCHSENMEFMNETGITVYLELTSTAAVSRLKSGKDQRPILAGRSDNELESFVEKHLNSRRELYERSAITLQAINADVDEVLRLIQAK